MKKLIFNLIKNSFVKNVVVMVSGTAGAQAITMAFSPIVTRLYGPDAFGVMGTFNSMLNIIIPIAALTYPIAIVLPKNDKDATGLAKLSLKITGLITLISLLLIFLFNHKIVDIFNLKGIAGYLYLIPLVIVFSGIMQVTEQWLIRTKQFSINARATFYQSIIINTGKVGLGFIYPFGTILIILTAIGNGLRALIMIVFAKKSDSIPPLKGKTNFKDIKKLAKKYYDFPVYRSPEVFLNGISNGLPVLMLTSYFGPASAGFYTIGRTVLRLPTQLIGKSVGDVFYPRIAEAANKGLDVTKLIKKTTLALAGVGIVPYGLVILFGPTLFSFVFGGGWEVAGEYARWISLWSFFGFMNRPSVHALPVLNAQRFHLIFTIIMLIARLSVLAIGYYIFSSDLVAVALFAVTGAVLNFGLIIATLKISKKTR